MDIYDYVVIIFCFFWIVSEIILNRIKILKDNVNTKVKDNNSLAVIWIAVFLSVIISIIFTEVLEIGNILKYKLVLIIFSFILIIIGSLIRYKAIFILKKAYSVNISISKNQKIIKKWLYKKVRHPGYLGMLISFIGLGLSFRNFYALIVVIIINILSLLNRINLEEKIMKEHFGYEYEKYCKETFRLIYKVY